MSSIGHVLSAVLIAGMVIFLTLCVRAGGVGLIKHVMSAVLIAGMVVFLALYILDGSYSEPPWTPPVVVGSGDVVIKRFAARELKITPADPPVTYNPTFAGCEAQKRTLDIQDRTIATQRETIKVLDTLSRSRWDALLDRAVLDAQKLAAEAPDVTKRVEDGKTIGTVSSEGQVLAPAGNIKWATTGIWNTGSQMLIKFEPTGYISFLLEDEEILKMSKDAAWVRGKPVEAATETEEVWAALVKVMRAWNVAMPNECGERK